MRFPKMILLACALALPACTAMSPRPGTVSDVTAHVSDRVERASAAYYATKPMVDVLAALMPTAYADRIRAAQAAVEDAFTAARIATTAAEEIAELRKAAAERRKIAALTGPT